MSRLIRSVGASALAMALLAGCGSSKKSTTTSATEAPTSAANAAIAAQVPAAIKAKGNLIVASEANSNVVIYPGLPGTLTGSGGFDARGALVLALLPGSRPRALAVADFNGDGQLDIATANYGTNDVSVLLSRRTGLSNPSRDGARMSHSFTAPALTRRAGVSRPRGRWSARRWAEQGER